MPRIACLHIPRFQIAVQQKHEQLKGCPLGLIKGRLTTNGYNRARIFICSQEAEQYDIVADMCLSEAKAQCAELIVREYDDVLYKTAERNLVIDLIRCSPKVKAKEMGIILLDASGLSLSGGENKFCHQVLKASSLAGFTDAYIGIADSAFAAIVASHANKNRITIIPTGHDAQFLAPLSIQHLKLATDIEETLLDLGINTMGKLAKIPISELNTRFAKNNEIIWKPWELAQGIDNFQPTLPEAEKTFESMLDLGGAVSQFNEILFALKSMLDRLTFDLIENGLWAQELIISLYNDTNKFDERILPLIQPTYNSKFLLEIIRLSLNAKPLARELTCIKIKISRFSTQEWQQTNLDKLADHQEKEIFTTKQNALNNHKLKQAELLLLQRFAARLGKNKIFKAEASDQYLSENAGVWIPIANQSIDNAAKTNILPLDLKYLNATNNNQMISDLVLRATLPAPVVLVQLDNTKPVAINYKKRWYKIKSITNPEYLSCQWWSNAVAKDYYKILVESVDNNQQTLLMLLAHDKLINNWRIEGIYD